MDLSKYCDRDGFLSPSKVVAARGTLAVLNISRGLQVVAATLGNERSRAEIRRIDAEIARIELDMWVLWNMGTNNYRKRKGLPMRRRRRK